MKYVLEMKNIFKSFPGVRVLKNVSISIKPGEVHAIMGENGAGKSTLMKILMGIYRSDSGEIILEGKNVTITGVRDALSKGISMIHQELNTLLDMEISENIFVGREITKKGFGKLNIIDKVKMREMTQEYMEQMQINIKPNTLMRDLSVAQMQLIEIVKAISLNSKIIIMDEPTSAITDRETEILFNQIERLKKQGVAIIYISHKMEEIFKIADRVTVLRDGELIAAKDIGEIDEETLISMMVGRKLNDMFPKEYTKITGAVLKVENLSRGHLVKNISFQLRQGEVLGIAGLVGSGRSELVETIFGIYPKEMGKIFVNEKLVDIRTPADAISYGIALITEDRKRTGLNLAGTIKENMSMVSLDKKLSCRGIIDLKKEKNVVNEYMKELGIKAPDENTLVSNLSGGNQQKVVLAKWIINEPDILIFDEPTRGIDVGAKREIYQLINSLAMKGKSIIVISSEMEEIIGISDRILVMCEGVITGELYRKDFSQEKIMEYASYAERKAI